MNELKVLGTQQFMSKQIPIVLGGFGENCKVMLVKTIGEIHKMNVGNINQRINENRHRFKDNIDVIDLKVSYTLDVLLDLGFNQSQINASKNIYLLSERGYAKLIKIMDTDLAWEIHDKLMDEYFTMKEIIQNNEQMFSQLLLKIYNGGEQGVLASKKLAEIEVEKAKKPLVEKIEQDKPLVTFAETSLKSKDNILVRELAKIISDEGYKIGQNKLYEQLREWNLIMRNSTEPYQTAIEKDYFVVEQGQIDTPFGIKLTKTTKVTPKGQLYIMNKVQKLFDGE